MPPAGYDLTLVTAADIPWVADGLMRECPEVSITINRMLLDELAAAPLSAVSGDPGNDFLSSAASEVTNTRGTRSVPRAAGPVLKVELRRDAEGAAGTRHQVAAQIRRHIAPVELVERVVDAGAQRDRRVADAGA
jgi:hypothetical protein